MNKIAIFDLDGTLLDTIADLAAAANHALDSFGYPTHETNAYRFFTGSGLNMLFFRALPEDARNEEEVLKVRQAFVDYYRLHSEDTTAPYSGIRELLMDLSAQGVALAVASNKYQEATRELVAKYFPEIEFAAVFGQREGIPVKPDPRIIEDILLATGYSKENVFYVGDSDVDMLTAKGAGVKGIGVTWGFRPKEELQLHEPFAMADTPSEVARICLGL